MEKTSVRCSGGINLRACVGNAWGDGVVCRVGVLLRILSGMFLGHDDVLFTVDGVLCRARGRFFLFDDILFPRGGVLWMSSGVRFPGSGVLVLFSGCLRFVSGEIAYVLP